jgi:prolipoprotein diacylglyceryltransferase
MIGLYINWDVDSEIINIGGFPIKYYGLLFAAGLLLSMAILKKIYKTENLNDSAHEALFLYGIIDFCWSEIGALLLL